MALRSAQRKYNVGKHLRMAVPGIISRTQDRSRWRAALVICVVFAFLGIQFASAIHTHSDDRESGHACALCYAGHIPVSYVVAEICLAPPDLTDWGIQREESPAIGCYQPAFQLSRAPPA